MVTHRSRNTTLGSLLDVIMDKGVIVDSRAKVRFSDIDLLNTKSRIALSSFKTAKQIGLKFPENTNFDTKAWQVLTAKQSCPNCHRESSHEDLKEECPWCGWICRQDMR